MSQLQLPTIGRIVHYHLSTEDAAQINRRRTNEQGIKERLGHPEHPAGLWPQGAQAHIGNEAAEGQVYPMLITRVWGNEPSSCVNGQVFLDGNDVLWALSVKCGEGPKTYAWPTRS